MAPPRIRKTFSGFAPDLQIDLKRPCIGERKTVWATIRIVFLGILLDGHFHILALPEEKITKAVYLLKLVLSKKKAMVKQIQKLTGLLNFLPCAIYPGRAFTRWMYAKIAGVTEKNSLKPLHHISLDTEFRQDCYTWLSF